ncbi:hypothetical protein BGW41_007705 [Actinomortierella wolfii]|nr:hypothetical protein BGW41_007705 [Actinomortierella wolfii]
MKCCGLHIAEALAGLRMDQICRCDDDYDSEHPFTLPTEPTSTLTLQTAASGTPTAATFATPSSTGSGTDLSTPVASTSASSSPFPPVQVPDHPCELPVPASSSDPLTPEAEIQYRLSKISSKSAELAAIRHAQQQAALKELQRIQEQQQAKLKQANETAFNRLLGGLKDAVGETEDALSNK